ncbi:hypothetical protein EYZ11_010263 [Aspergillus tanneri]|uniref:Uncharacterized protein n=1 Tax=Aspergillus tanneri TaxID=1220188 RepID=A0A4S3J5T4_9EURO|nr:hypothetical protein EYZ11_010263 [Aspergillus tanneri]
MPEAELSYLIHGSNHMIDVLVGFNFGALHQLSGVASIATSALTQ